jgi:hypothetical protein
MFSPYMTDYMNKSTSGMWNGLGVPYNWLLPAPDLTPLEFHVWCCIET